MRPIVNMPEEDIAHAVVPEISSRTDTHEQTNRQTYSSQYFATNPAGEVLNVKLNVELSKGVLRTSH